MSALLDEAGTEILDEAGDEIDDEGAPATFGTARHATMAIPRAQGAQFP